MAVSLPTSSRNGISIWPARSYDRALWRLASAWILVPSSATVPNLSTPISRAMTSTCTNSASICWRKRRLFEEAPAEAGDRVVVGVLVGGDEAKRNRIVGRSLQFSAGKHARGITVDLPPPG
jgi:hypothetical protein